MVKILAAAAAVAAVASSATAFSNNGMGPGRGPWVVSTPEAHGLSFEALQASDNKTLARIPRRVCHLVVKNGEIVYENYHGRGDVDYASNGYSSTKSSCAALYGIAMEQGWADPSDKVKDKNSNMRRCNDDATFANVLTMTGTSRNINNPSFSYDTFGTSCLDALHDFIGENNPDGLSTEAWKDKYWHDALGMENHRWRMPANNGMLNMVCGSDQMITCRDMARNAQLFLNNGVWEGEQIMSEQFAKDSRIVSVDGGEEYGYTLWLNSQDPVDPLISSFEGMNGQSAYISTLHDAIVVTMGTDSGGQPAWDETRDAIVSDSFKEQFYEARAQMGPSEDAHNAAFPYEFKV